jgi:outer membrane protein OmpA-like peptidoglycan-associated protein
MSHAMQHKSTRATFLALVSAFATLPAAVLASQDQSSAVPQVTVTGRRPPTIAELPKGPVVKGIISARRGELVQITAADGAKTLVLVTGETAIKASGGFLGMGSSKLGAASLLNGVPVIVETVQWENGLVASKISLQAKDLRTAAMIHGGTDQRFTEQAAATEALRGRMADIDQYNVKSTTNVNFDTGKAVLSAQAKADLCAAATAAQATSNALLLVVGYTDSTGTQALNQALSEKRAATVVNYLQQACGWKPYRMLTPTGMAEADPMASNDTIDGKARNRRVSVNVLVSKGLDGL